MEKFREHACEFKNEAECEEELNEDASSLEEAELEYFGND